MIVIQRLPMLLLFNLAVPRNNVVVATDKKTNLTLVHYADALPIKNSLLRTRSIVSLYTTGLFLSLSLSIGSSSVARLISRFYPRLNTATNQTPLARHLSSSLLSIPGLTYFLSKHTHTHSHRATHATSGLHLHSSLFILCRSRVHSGVPFQPPFSLVFSLLLLLPLHIIIIIIVACFFPSVYFSIWFASSLSFCTVFPLYFYFSGILQMRVFDRFGLKQILNLFLPRWRLFYFEMT